MLRISKSIISILLIVFILLSFVFNNMVLLFAADADNLLVSDLSSKTIEHLNDENNEYEISLSVPGKDSQGYNEIIFMIDASESMFDSINTFIAAIKQIGEGILNSNSKIRFTLMHFGISASTLFSVNSIEDLNREIDKLDYQALRRWPTATNCEAALLHIQEYLINSPDLNKALVVFATDGAANKHEDPFYFYENRLTLKYTFGATTMSGYVDKIFSYFSEIQAVSDLTLEMFPEVFENLPEDYTIKDIAGSATIKSALKEAMKANDCERFKEWVNRFWAEAYENAGLDPTKAYPISTVEKAMISAHKMESIVHFAAAIGFLNAPYGNKTNCGNKAQEVGELLAVMPQVEELCIVDLSTYAWIDNLDKAFENVVVENGNTSNYVAKIVEYSSGFVQMPVNDPVITDPMSKWVDFQEGSIRIFKDEIEIWNQSIGWLIDEESRPVTNDAPIEVIPNTTTGKHTIKWKIKDGALLLSDNYTMKYKVTVDTEAEGFRYNTIYPANNTTYIDYINENGVMQRNGILVPQVEVHGTNTDEPDDSNNIKLVLHKFTDTDTDLEGVGKEVAPELLEGRNPIEGIIFDIYLVGTKYDLDYGYVPWSQKPTAEEIELYKTAERLVATVRTNVDGIAEFDLSKQEQVPGLYLIVERKADIIEAPVDPFYVLLPMHDPADLSKIMNTVHVYPKNDIIEKEEPDGVINIYKTDNTPDKVPLAGAKFKLGRVPTDDETPNGRVTVNGKVIDVVWVDFYTNDENTGEKVTEVTTDAEGKAVMAGLLYGTYYVKEVEAPENYIMLTEAKVVQVSKYSTSREVSVSFENILAKPLLPTTGGIGTKVFVVLGVLLTIIAATLIIMKSRMKNYGTNHEEKIFLEDEYI